MREVGKEREVGEVGEEREGEGEKWGEMGG